MNIIYINDIESPELKIYSGLSESQLVHFYEPEPGLFIAESPMIISRALAAGYVPESFLVEERLVEKIVAISSACRTSDDRLVEKLVTDSSVCGSSEDMLTEKLVTDSSVCGSSEDKLTEKLVTVSSAGGIPEDKLTEKLVTVSSAGGIPEDKLTDKLTADSPGRRFTENDEQLRVIWERIRHCDKVSVYSAPLEVLVRVTGYMFTRGILCAMRRKPMADVSSIMERSRRIAVLENVMNPTNVGAIFRSAAALGMDAVLLSEGCTDPLYRRAARVSMGTVFSIPWSYCKSNGSEGMNCRETVNLLKKAGFTTAAMALKNDSVDLRDFRPGPDEKVAIVLGTEGEGLSPDTIDACDITIRIPMANGVDSLNVAAASAVTFWHIN